LYIFQIYNPELSLYLLKFKPNQTKCVPKSIIAKVAGIGTCSNINS